MDSAGEEAGEREDVAHMLAVHSFPSCGPPLPVCRSTAFAFVWL